MRSIGKYLKQARLLWTVAGLVVFAILVVACEPSTPEPTPAPPGELPFTDRPPSITVFNQEIRNGQVVIAEVVSETDGWVVIHADEAGGAGALMGYVPVESGVNENVEVPVDVNALTQIMYVRLHVDVGTPGEFDFPGEDIPVQINGQILTVPFHVAGVAGKADAPASILVQDSVFSPGIVNIFVNETVTWHVEGSFPHTITADNGQFDSGQLSLGDTFEFTFTEPGEYPYHCQLHGGPGGQGMSGIIIVQP